MAANPAAGMTCGACGPSCRQTLNEGVWTNNPVAVQMLGVCSALAVTSRLENSIVMGMALIFVAAMSNLFVSLLRNATPRRIRMIAEVTIIATFVIVFDQLLKAFYPEMSESLGPYVGLIITNCIIMGRAEAFAMQNPPAISVVDGIANGLGYAAVLILIGAAREVLGSGELLGRSVLSPDWYTGNLVMILAPGAFIALGFLIALANHIKPPQTEASK